MLMAVLAKLCIVPVSFVLSKQSIAIHIKIQIKLALAKGVNCVQAKIDTCQLLMLTKRVNRYLKNLMFAHEKCTNASKAIDTSPYSMHNALQTQCSFENMPIIQLVM